MALRDQGQVIRSAGREVVRVAGSFRQSSAGRRAGVLISFPRPGGGAGTNGTRVHCWRSGRVALLPGGGPAHLFAAGGRRRPAESWEGPIFAEFFASRFTRAVYRLPTGYREPTRPARDCPGCNGCVASIIGITIPLLTGDPVPTRTTDTKRTLLAGGYNPTRHNRSIRTMCTNSYDNHTMSGRFVKRFYHFNR